MPGSASAPRGTLLIFDANTSQHAGTSPEEIANRPQLGTVYKEQREEDMAARAAPPAPGSTSAAAAETTTDYRC